MATSGRLACVYICDKNYLPPTCFSIASLASSASQPVPVFLLHHALPASEQALAEQFFADRRLPVTMIALNEGQIDRFPRHRFLPKASFGRLMLSEYLPSTFDRVLYIDGDTLVDRDVVPLGTYDLQSCTIGAVPDLGMLLNRHQHGDARRCLGLGERQLYFNSGVLLIDWQKWLAADPLGKSLDVLRQTPDKFRQGDQCVLNYLMKDHWRRMELTWNWQPNSARFNPEVRDAIFHFLGSKKPWNSAPLKHPAWVTSRYRDYAINSPWAARLATSPQPTSDWVRVAKEIMTPRYWRDRDLYRRNVLPQL